MEHVGANTMAGTVPAGRFTRPGEEVPSGTRESRLASAREAITTPGRFLVLRDGDANRAIALEREWTRIGRSLAADLRFDDATVSRRHALIANEEGGVRVLDDRSLNGIQVNGRRVEWSPLADGDMIVIGRHTVYFMDTTKAENTAESAAVAD